MPAKRSCHIFRMLIVGPMLFFLLHFVFEANLCAQTTTTSQTTNVISLSDAIQLTKNYQATASPGSQIAEYFGASIFKTILSQPGCSGIRIYFGKNSDGSPALVLVGVDGSGKDITTGAIGEKGFPCPPICDSTNILGH